MRRHVIKAGIIFAIYGSAAEEFRQTECKRKGSAQILSGSRTSMLCAELQLAWPVRHSFECIPLAKPACKACQSLQLYSRMHPTVSVLLLVNWP